MSIQVTSTLLRNAEYRRTLAGQAAVIFVLRSSHGMAVEAKVTLGTDVHAHVEAERLAARAHAGDPCRVRAEGAIARQDHDLAVIVLQGIRTVSVRYERVFSFA